MPKQYAALVLAEQIADLVKDARASDDDKFAALETAKHLIRPDVHKRDYPLNVSARDQERVAAAAADATRKALSGS